MARCTRCDLYRTGTQTVFGEGPAEEIAACSWWLKQERMLLQPRIIVALGATAARFVGDLRLIGKQAETFS